MASSFRSFGLALPTLVPPSRRGHRGPRRVSPVSTSSARTAYETLEPLHVLAYFNPGLREAWRDLDIDGTAFYVGARAAPMGLCSAAVVTAAFYNFSPALIETAWGTATERGLAEIADRRDRMLDEQLSAILGDRADDPFLVEAADRYADLAAGLPTGGRALAAAWAAAGLPDGPPHLRLWHAVAVLREWRGDNHLAALLLHGLDGIDALTFHEAQLPDPEVRARRLGKKLTLATRGYSEQEWNDSVARLIERGLAELADDAYRLTPTGMAVFLDIEAETDAAGEQVWSAPGTTELLIGTRPFVKAIIDAGVLPGTRTRPKPGI